MTFPFVMMSLIAIVVMLICATLEYKPLSEERADMRRVNRDIEYIANQIRLSRP